MKEKSATAELEYIKYMKQRDKIKVESTCE